MIPLEGARVLITGASGFVGSHLCRLLTARGALVSGLGHEDAPPATVLTEWFSAGIDDSPAVSAAVASARPDAVVHLAGQASAGRSFQSPVETFRINVTGTWTLLDAVRRHAPAARVIAVGSGEAYGPQPEGARVTEDAPFRPVSPYAFSKAVADTIAARAENLDVVRTRSFSHTGPGQTLGFALPSWAAQIAGMESRGRAGALQVGNLDVMRDILDVRDVVECYLKLLESGARGEAYNVCRGEGVSLREIAEMLTRMARVPVRIEVDPSRVRPADVPCLVGDPAKTLRATGWQPRCSVSEMVGQLLDYWRNRPAAEQTGSR